MALFLVVFVLGDPRVHVYPLYSNNEVADIETFIDEVFSLSATLDILNVYLNDHYI